MIQRTDLQHMTPQQRARVIYTEAQSALSNRLWRAALGDGERDNGRDAGLGGSKLQIDSLLQLLGSGDGVPGMAGLAGLAPKHCACTCACSCHHPDAAQPGWQDAADGESRGRGQDDTGSRYGRVAATDALAPAVEGAGGLNLGANARHAGTIAAAEARTGIPATAIAAIVDAEAAKGADGSWNTHSRNPRSSAAGLGQFLSGTWQRLAETPGTWLNTFAAQQGWLDGRGKVNGGARGDLLALRYDPQASILTVADLAKRNVEQLERAGLRVRADSETLAKAAYLGHHLGLADARKFLAGGIEAGRARMLLAAQIGSGAAEQRIAEAGDATRAHREWLLSFINRRIRPERFAG